MATKKKPIHEIWLGAIRATIWANDSSSGERWYTLTTSRMHKDSNDQWQSTHTFKVQHLPALARAIASAHAWIEQRTVEPEAKQLIKDLLHAATSKNLKKQGRQHEN